VSWYVDGYKVVIASTFFEPSILPAGSMKKAFVSGISSTVMTTTTKSALLFFKYDHRRLTKDQLLLLRGLLLIFFNSSRSMQAKCPYRKGRQKSIGVSVACVDWGTKVWTLDDGFVSRGRYLWHIVYLLMK
jgi:hypothetical protein